MSYYIRERVKGSVWDFNVLDSAIAEFTTSSEGNGFHTLEDAVAAWRDLPIETKDAHPRAYIIGPRCGCYRPHDGKRMRKDPEA